MKAVRMAGLRLLQLQLLYDKLIKNNLLLFCYSSWPSPGCTYSTRTVQKMNTSQAHHHKSVHIILFLAISYLYLYIEHDTIIRVPVKNNDINTTKNPEKQTMAPWLLLELFDAPALHQFIHQHQ